MTTIIKPKKNQYHLIEFEYGDPDAPTYLYLTDYTKNISYDSQTWLKAPKIALTLPPNTGSLEEKALKIEIQRSLSTLFANLVTGEPHSPTYVTVTRVLEPLPDDGGTNDYYVLTLAFRVAKATSNPGGNKKGFVELEAVSVKNQMKVPCGMPGNYHCGWVLFGTGCGLSVISTTGTLSAIDATDARKVTISAGSVTVPGATPGNVFHRGYVEFQGNRIDIREWTTGASTTFYLCRKPPASWVGQTVTVVVGCDKTKETCIARFDNIAQIANAGYRAPNYHPSHEVPDA